MILRSSEGDPHNRVLNPHPPSACSNSARLLRIPCLRPRIILRTPEDDPWDVRCGNPGGQMGCSPPTERRSQGSSAGLLRMILGVCGVGIPVAKGDVPPQQRTAPKDHPQNS